MEQQNKERGFGYAFKQQIMKAWQPVPTLNSTITLFAILSVFFLVMGIVLISFSNNINVNEVRYDALCPTIGAFCNITIALDQDFPSPVYLYYELNNFYQNHRRYVKSKSYTQLSGSNLGVGSLDECSPAIRNDEMQLPLPLVSYTGVPLNGSAPAIPCGLIAKSFFNDTFQLYYSNSSGLYKQNISETNIAWPSDKNGRYSNINSSLQWMDMENGTLYIQLEHFMVWMRTAALPKFRKLWGRIETTLQKGIYYYIINNQYNVSYFNGQKSLVLSTTNAFGGKNDFLSIAYICVGVACSVITIGFTIRKYLSKYDQKKSI